MYACNDMLCYLPRFVDKLYTIQPGENESYLPSPEALREKILVKVSDANLFPLLEFYSLTISIQSAHDFVNTCEHFHMLICGIKELLLLIFSFLLLLLLL